MPTSESESEELELEELEESLELSEAMPVDSCKSTESAKAANSGCSCFRTLEEQKQNKLQSAFYYLIYTHRGSALCSLKNIQVGT